MELTLGQLGTDTMGNGWHQRNMGKGQTSSKMATNTMESIKKENLQEMESTSGPVEQYMRASSKMG